MSGILTELDVTSRRTMHRIQAGIQCSSIVAVSWIALALKLLLLLVALKLLLLLVALKLLLFLSCHSGQQRGIPAPLDSPGMLKRHFDLKPHPTSWNWNSAANRTHPKP
jgi:hypothetical protein